MVTAQAIETACIKQLREWEEAAGIRKRLDNPKLARDKTYYIGLGTRVVAYKSRVGIDGHLSSKPTASTKSLFSFWS